MNYTISEENEKIMINVEGNFDVMGIMNFRNEVFRIDDGTGKDFFVDLKDVEYIDSSGIGLLIKISKLQKQKNKNLFLANPAPRVRDLLKLSSLGEYLV